MTKPSRRHRLEELLHESDTLAAQLRGVAARLDEFLSQLDHAEGGDHDVEGTHADA